MQLKQIVKIGFGLVVAAAAWALPAHADPVVYHSVYSVPTIVEDASGPSTQLLSSVDLGDGTLTVTYTLPLCITGGQLNRIVLTGTLDRARDVYVMSADQVEASECILAAQTPQTLICSSKYQRDKLSFGAPADGVGPETASTPAQVRARLHVAAEFMDEPRGTLNVALSPPRE